MREAPSIDIITELQKKGAAISAYDPVAMENAKGLLTNVTFCKNAYDAVSGADAAVFVTEWNEFRHLDLVKVKTLMKHPILFDGRNIYEPRKAKDLGFRYTGVGRS